MITNFDEPLKINNSTQNRSFYAIWTRQIGFFLFIEDVVKIDPNNDLKAFCLLEIRSLFNLKQA